MRNRLALVVALVAVASPILVTPAPAQDPPRRRAPPTPTARIRGEVAALASLVAVDRGTQLSYVAGSSALNVIRGRAWFLTVAVSDAPSYAGEFFVLSWIDGRLIGELMHAPGVGGTRTLEGEDLTRFLARVELDDAPIRAAFERWLGGPVSGRF